MSAPTASKAPAPSLLTSLRHRDFRLLMASLTLSAIGSWAYNLALTVWVFDRTGSVGWVGAVTVCRFVPALLFSAYAGVVADRVEKVRLMLGLDAAAAVLMASMAVLMAADAPIVAVVLMAVLSTLINITYEPAATALTPLAVTETDLGSANTLRNTVENLTVIAGPGLGVVLLALGSPQAAVAANSLSFVASALLVARIRVRSERVDVTEGGTVGPVRQMRVGIAAILTSPTSGVLVAYSLLVTVGFGMDTVMFVSISDHVLGTGANGYGYLLAGCGLGGIAAAPLVARLESRPRLALVILVGTVLFFLPTMVFLVTSSPAVGFVAEVVRGAGTLVVDVLAVTAMQRTLAQDMLARVFGAFGSLILLSILIGSSLAPVLISVLGLDAAIWFAGLGLSVVGLLGWPLLRRMDALSAASLEQLAPRMRVLEGLDLFSVVPEGTLAQLATAARQTTVPAGTRIIGQGEPADAFYVIEAGELAVHATVDDGREVDLPTMRPGGYFGEIGLIESTARTATVTSLTEARLLVIDGEAFVAALTVSTSSTSFVRETGIRLARTRPVLT